MPIDSGALRIGEFARRVGVSAELLRAWERRYGLLAPLRSPGGFRLYTAEDAERVGRMRLALAQGLSAAEAARISVDAHRPSRGLIGDVRATLIDAIRRYDEAEVHAVLDESISGFGLEAVLGDLILPALHQLGSDWRSGTLEVSQEHFASNLIRGRLLSWARLWGRGGGPLALLACPPGEAHDIGLLAFGLVLRSYGWRILFLGADTPIATLADAAGSTEPALVVIASFEAQRFEAEARRLRAFAKRFPLALSGPGATTPLCTRLGVRRLDGDPISAASLVAAGRTGRGEHVV